MTWLRKVWAVLRKRPLDVEFTEELQAHVDMLTDDNVAAGMSPEEARRRARLAVGNLGVAHELHREARGLPSVESVLQDLRYAFRTLARDAGFATIAVLILGLGIASNAVVFSLVDTLVLRPLPFAESDRLVWIANGAPGETNPSVLASRVLTFQGWQQNSRTLIDVAAYNPFFKRDNWALTHDGHEPERLKGVLVTHNLLPMLGVPMLLGRSFTEEEVTDGGPAAVIVTHRLWQRSLESDPAIIGKSIELNDQPRTVVGVTPADFDFGSVFEPGYEVDLLLPGILDVMLNWGNTLAVVGRLAPGVPVDVANQELKAVTVRFVEEQPELNGSTVEAQVTPLQDHVSAPVRGALWLLWGAVGVVLVIVCANLSNLMLVRSVGRRREMAVRAALGAGHGRLVRQLLTESFALASLGVLVGLGLAWLALRALTGSGIVVLPMLERVSLNGAVVAVAVAITAGVTFVVGAMPALQLSRSEPFGDLGASTRGTVGDRLQNWTRSGLVVAEVALACALLIGAGLLIRSFGQLMDVNLGFEPTGRASLPVSVGQRYDGAPEVTQFQTEMLDAIRQVSGVEGAALTDSLPLDGNRSWGVRRAGTADEEQPRVTAFVRLVSDGYFQTMGIPLVAGREFNRDEELDGALAIVLNESAARALWPDEAALGRSVVLAAGEAQVIGVVGDVRHNGLAEASGPEMYLALTQYWSRSTSLVVRTAGDPLALTGQIRAALHDVDPRVPFTDFQPLRHLVDRAVSARRFFMATLAGFAGMALILASLGIYGVISYSVGQRRAEFGVRLALGALPGRLLMEELRSGLTLTVAGLAIGLASAIFASRLMASQLYGVSNADPVTYAAMATVLLAVGLLAVYVPARRAAGTNPVTALRDA